MSNQQYYPPQPYAQPQYPVQQPYYGQPQYPAQGYPQAVQATQVPVNPADYFHVAGFDVLKSDAYIGGAVLCVLILVILMWSEIRKLTRFLPDKLTGLMGESMVGHIRDFFGEDEEVRAERVENGNTLTGAEALEFDRIRAALAMYLRREIVEKHKATKAEVVRNAIETAQAKAHEDQMDWSEALEKTAREKGVLDAIALDELIERMEKDDTFLTERLSRFYERSGAQNDRQMLRYLQRQNETFRFYDPTMEIEQRYLRIAEQSVVRAKGIDAASCIAVEEVAALAKQEAEKRQAERRAAGENATEAEQGDNAEKKDEKNDGAKKETNGDVKPDVEDEE